MIFKMVKQGYSTKGNKIDRPPKYHTKNDKIPARRAQQRDYIKETQKKGRQMQESGESRYQYWKRNNMRLLPIGCLRKSISKMK